MQNLIKVQGTQQALLPRAQLQCKSHAA